MKKQKRKIASGKRVKRQAVDRSLHPVVRPEFSRHGQLSDDGMTRWCDGCGHYHGHMYSCKHYPKKLKAALVEQSNQYRRNLTDPEYIAGMIASGIPPPEGVVIFQAMAGIFPSNPELTLDRAKKETP